MRNIPTTCFTMGMVCSGIVFLPRTFFFACRPESTVFVSSEQSSLYMFAAFPTWLVAESRENLWLSFSDSSISPDLWSTQLSRPQIVPLVDLYISSRVTMDLLAASLIDVLSLPAS
ncbi:hypothetical protein CHARACLAT_021001 [Characodon lateralis]|uniref:Secreted protein n=1 Tax=Characodon lateralis TaxID=208331 RepID=A0ABU7DSW3_9TELE|nr:hypothetical protein [Characodon lateralis]